MAKKFKNLEEALEAQKEAKETVKEAKQALTDYFTKNKLKRNQDYTDDAKHGAKIERLQKEIDKASNTLADVNSQVSSLKPGKGKAGREMKYEYPPECKTAEQRKKYRIEQRKKANNADKPKKETSEKPKKETSKKEVENAKPKASAKKVKSKSSAAESEESTEKTSSKKVVKKKAKKPSNDD